MSVRVVAIGCAAIALAAAALAPADQANTPPSPPADAVASPLRVGSPLPVGAAADPARATGSSALGDCLGADFSWPLGGAVSVVRPFDPPAEPWLAGHRGVDLHAPPGTAVLAPRSGVISFAGMVVNRHLVVVDHGELRSTLEPVFPEVTPGTAVLRGQQIGTVSPEPAHMPDSMHWGVRRGDAYLDPTLLVCPAPRAVLLD
ncbi:MAG: M23 family metallopeptidase [Bifidobacteriaceae bacterium]|jgi:murein DD-endopeptidase MepM/ murein hydrolase activator NlpD|nr:M23 family metallopeptidase [Bifidobacteriaceae bacterium]